MLPELLRIGDFPIHTYGVLIALGFLLCVWVSRREGKRLGIPVERIVDLGFWSILIGMVGARILFVITRWQEFWAAPVDIFRVWEGGLVFYGGPLACLPFFLWYTKKYGLPRWKILDIAAVAVPLAHAFGRLGCLSSGCCYGIPTGGDWGLRLHSPLLEAHLQGVPLHPTQIYEGAGLFVLFFYLRWKRRHKAFDGQLLFLYAIGYSALRIVVEFFRGDLIRGFVIQDYLSTSQFIALLVIVAAVLAYKMREMEWKRAQALT